MNQYRKPVLSFVILAIVLPKSSCFSGSILPSYSNSFINEIDRELRFINSIKFPTDYKSDPVASQWMENYITFATTNVNEPTKQISICLRVIPYSTIQQCLFYDNGISLVFTTEKYGFLLINTNWIMFKFHRDLVPLRWYQFCVSYDDGYIVIMMNGNTLIDETFDSFKDVAVKDISFNDTFSIGLCIRDNYGPLEAITRGKITDLNIWFSSISKNDMHKFTTDCFYKISGDALKPVLTWKDYEVVKQGSMAQNTTERVTEVCGMKDDHKVSLILPIKQPYQPCKQSCERLGGNLPLPQGMDDIGNITEGISWKNRKDENHESRIDKQCGNEIWMPIIQAGKDDSTGEYLWAVDVGNDSSNATFLPWEPSQPNGQDLQPCVYLNLNTKGYTDLACDRAFCCLCEFSGEVNFHLHGIPDTYEADTHYIFVPKQQTADDLVFIGYKRNQISWKSKQNRWVFIDRSDVNNTIAYSNITHNAVLVGLSNWQVYPDEKSEAKEEIEIQVKLTKVNILMSL